MHVLSLSFYLMYLYKLYCCITVLLLYDKCLACLCWLCDKFHTCKDLQKLNKYDMDMIWYMTVLVTYIWIFKTLDRLGKVCIHESKNHINSVKKRENLIFLFWLLLHLLLFFKSGVWSKISENEKSGISSIIWQSLP
jgi:hypothetical protein